MERIHLEGWRRDAAPAGRALKARAIERVSLPYICMQHTLPGRVLIEEMASNNADMQSPGSLGTAPRHADTTEHVVMEAPKNMSSSCRCYRRRTPWCCLFSCTLQTAGNPGPLPESGSPAKNRGPPARNPGPAPAKIWTGRGSVMNQSSVERTDA